MIDNLQSSAVWNQSPTIRPISPSCAPSTPCAVSCFPLRFHTSLYESSSGLTVSLHEVGAGARCCSRLTRVVSSFSWPVVLTAPLLVSFYSFLVCWRSAGGAGMVVVAVVLVERLMAREKRRQELRLRAAVQNKTSRPLPTPERACPGEVKPEPPPAGPTRGVYQVS